MKTKTITKTFYVSDSYINMIEKNEDTYLSPVMTGSNRIEVQISWNEPERKIEITESEFDEAVFSFFKLDENNNSPISRGTKMQEHLKQKLFGASDERN